MIKKRPYMTLICSKINFFITPKAPLVELKFEISFMSDNVTNCRKQTPVLISAKMLSVCFHPLYSINNR